MHCKALLTDSLEFLLMRMRERRAYYAAHLGTVKEIVYEGTRKARSITCSTMEEVREAMMMNYFK